MNSQSKAKHLEQKRRFWKSHVQAWKKSGYTQREYCNHNDLVPHRFTYWKLKFEKAAKDTISFIPVTLLPQKIEEAGNKNTFMVHIQQRRFQVEVGDAFSTGPLTRLIRILEAV